MMMSQALRIFALCLLISGVFCIQDLIIISKTGKYNELLTLSLNVSTEYVLIYPESKATNPYRVKAWSTNAKAHLPILLVVRQVKQVASWTVPEVIETSKNERFLNFFNTSRIMCHDNMDALSAPSKPEFSIQPLKISQSFILAASTSSPTNVSINIEVEEEKDFFIQRDKKYSLTVSPSQPKYSYFKFDVNASDTVIIQVNSDDDVCLTISVQDSQCPVFDSNKDVKFEGIFQTINKIGAFTIPKRRYPRGFFLVFVAKPDDYECSQENSVIPLPRDTVIADNNITSSVNFVIRNSIHLKEYLFASLGTLLAVAMFGLVFTGITFLFNRHGALSKAAHERLNVKDYIEPMDEDDINEIVLSSTLTVDKFAKYPNRIKQRSFNYLSHTMNIALFYSIPVIQLVVTYQRVVNLTGNQDTCYYNFLCAHPALGFSDFNHIFSNIGYVVIGIFFIIAVIDRQTLIGLTKDKGIPVHYGLFYAMGVALIIEGILSACYHICPSQSNYQFDTSFMYVMAVLIMVKLYQNRHPDINATAYSTFSVVGLAIFIAMIGILDGTLVIWIIFIIGYTILIVILSLKIYYLNYVLNGVHQLQNSYKLMGFQKKTFAPIRKGRFILLTIANLANFGMLGYGLYVYLAQLTDFGTFLLELLLGNTVIHVVFYTSMKFHHKEKLCLEAIVFGVLCFCCWLAAGYFFFDWSTMWTVTPAESRQWNKKCVFINFFDKHDVWHLLSAPALYFTFLYLMYLDDDLWDKRQSEIPVF